MNVRSKLKTDCTIYNMTSASLTSTNPADFDRYGNPKKTETSTATKALIMPQTIPAVSPEIETGGDVTHASFIGYFAPDAVIYGDSRVEWTDHFNVSHKAQVYGEPKRLEDAHARAVLISCELKETISRGYQIETS